MNSAEQRPQNQQENVAPTPEKPPLTLEEHAHNFQVEVAKIIDAQTVNARLEAVKKEHDTLQERLKKEAEAKSTLGSYMDEARRKFGLLSEQQKADDAARKKMEVEMIALQKRRLELSGFDTGDAQAPLSVEVQVDDAPEQAPAFQSPDGIAANQVEADFFAEGDRMNAAVEQTRVQVNDTPAVIAEQTVPVETAQNTIGPDEDSIETELIRAVTPEDDTTVVDKEEEVEEGHDLDGYEGDMSDEAPSELPQEPADAVAEDIPAEVAVDEVIEADGGEDDDEKTAAAMAETVIGELQPTQEAANNNVSFENPETQPSTDPVSEHIEQVKEAQENVNEALQKLEKDREALIAQLTEWGLEALTTNIINKNEKSFVTVIQSLAEEKGWPQKPESKSFSDRIARLFVVKETPTTKPDVQTIVKTLLRLRNTDRAIQRAVTPWVAEGLNSRPTETSAERIQRRLNEATQRPPKQPDNVITFPEAATQTAATPEDEPELRKAA